jgi:CubicO group peptidase (beta-lactamase class C family)
VKRNYQSSIWVVALSLCASASQGSFAQNLDAVDAALRPLVDDGAVSGVVILVARKGVPIHASAYGKQDLATATSMRMDSIFRAFSMTKPVTAVAMMMLYEEGKWRLSDPITKYLPEFGGLRVYKGNDAQGNAVLAPPTSVPTMLQLMTHTAGFSYGFGTGYVEDQYRAANPLDATSTDDFLRRVAALPLLYEPGTQWQYSLSMDLQGVIVERLSGLPLAQFLDRRLFKPLRMVDSGFHVPSEKRSRFATLYTSASGQLAPVTAQDVLGINFLNSSFAAPPGFALGGAGMVTTAPDYLRFGQMLLNGGTLNGVRILNRKSVRMIMSSHISKSIADGKYGIGMQQIRRGYEYGFNGVVVTDPKLAQADLGQGSYLWDGAAGTWFWIDPTNQIVFVGMLQRLMAAGGMPNHETISQTAVRTALGSSFRLER